LKNFFVVFEKDANPNFSRAAGGTKLISAIFCIFFLLEEENLKKFNGVG